jgi:hypothetical protein
LRCAARHYGPVTHQPDLLPNGTGAITSIGIIADLIEAGRRIARAVGETSYGRVISCRASVCWLR